MLYAHGEYILEQIVLQAMLRYLQHHHDVTVGGLSTCLVESLMVMWVQWWSAHGKLEVDDYGHGHQCYTLTQW
jgi:hypothetical protein